jgi:hypothetical protein
MSATICLADDQLVELADLIAARLTQPSPQTSLTDAASIAEALGVSRAFVYAHSTALGGRRLNGHGRIRFDVERAREAFAEMPARQDERPAPRKRRTSRMTTGHVLPSRPVLRSRPRKTA